MTSADANVRTELPMSKVQVLDAERTAGSGTGPRRATSLVLVGALLGLAWSSGLRGFMAQVAGNESTVGWTPTFLWVLLPGVIIGGLLGWAEHRRRVGRRTRWLALSPLLFSAILFSRPWDILSMLEDGLGGGALGVPLFGMAGGYALAGRLTWVRVLCGMVAASTIPIWALAVTSFAPHLAVDSPRGAWAALYYYSFMATLMLACAIPLRASPVARDDGQSMEGETDLSVPVGLPARPLAKTARSSRHRLLPGPRWPTRSRRWPTLAAAGHPGPLLNARRLRHAIHRSRYRGAMRDPAKLQRFRHPFKGFRALSGLTAVVFLAACSAGPSTPTGSAAPTASTGPPVYASTTFVVPFDVGPPGWLDPKPTTEQSNFVTWEAPGDPHVPAVRFLVPVNVYPPGGNGTTEPPQDYLAYLLDQTSHGAHFTDQAQRTVGDQPATILTATVDNSLDGSLGCPAADTAASDCFGLQPDLALRMAVVRVRERTLLIWLRTDSRMDETDKKSKIQAFENMLQTIRFSDRSVQPPTTSVVNSNPIFAVVARYSPKSLGLSKPANLAIGPDGSFYITDASQRVSVVSRQGKVLRRWGHRGSGPGEFSFVSSVAAIAVAANGNVYVADSGNSRIEVFNPRGKFLRQFGSGGVGKGLPLAIAVDRDGSAYVTNDKEQTVSKFSERGGLKWTRGGNSETDPDLVGHFHFASLDSHNRLVMANDDAARVVYLDMNGQKVDAFGSPGDFPKGPCDVTVDSAGETFVGSCVSPYSLQAFNASHQLVGTSSPSGLAWVPRFGPHNQVVALADDGSVMSLRMKLPKK